jgi:hypothetical protein
MRDHLRPDVLLSSATDALTATQVVVIADRHNLRCASAQNALIATALLVARSGTIVHLANEDSPLIQSVAPVVGDRITESLSRSLEDLIPGVPHFLGTPTREPDFAVVLGDSRFHGKAKRVIRLSADAWSGAITSSGTGVRWAPSDSPFGALSAAGLTASEVFKAAMHRLKDAALDREVFDSLFAPLCTAQVSLAPPGTAMPSSQLGEFDIISCGAITQNALFALARIPGVEGRARVFEPERGDISNLNRYALLLRSRVDG